VTTTSITALVTAIVALVGAVTGLITAIRSIKKVDKTVVQVSANTDAIVQHDEAITVLQNGNGTPHESPAA